MNRLFLCAIFLLLATSCAIITDRQTDEQAAGEVIQEQETVDTACSYFYFLWGNIAEGEKRFAEAQEAYEKALLCDPRAGLIMRRLAVLLARMGKTNHAVMWMEKVIESYPGDIESRFWVAHMYGLMERNSEAIEIYLSILAEEPENLNALFFLGSLYLGNRDYEQAREILERLVILDAESFAGHKYLARLYREMRYWDRSAASFKKALGLGWSIPLALEAAEVIEQLDSGAAISLYGHILEEDEGNERARGRLTNLYLRNGEIDKAIKLLEDLRQYSTEVSRLDFTIGRILLGSERLDEAVAKFSMALDNDPDLQVARYFLAISYVRKEEIERAREILQEITTDFQDYEDTIVLLVSTYQDSEDYAAMENILTERIAEAFTRRARFYGLLAKVYRKQEKNDLAVEVFEQGLVDFPGNVELLFDYGVFLDSLGDHDGAMLKIGQVIELDHDNAIALNFVGYSWADRGVNLQKALEYIEKAIDLRPKDGYIRDSLGWVLFRLGEMDRARKELEEALEMAPDDPTIHEHLGDVHRAKGGVEDALQFYRQAESLYQDDKKKEEVENKIKELEGK